MRDRGGRATRRLGSLGAAALLAMMSGAGPSVAQTAAPLGQVVGLEGSVQVYHGGTARTVAIGANLGCADRLATDADSRVAVAFADGAEMVAGPATSVAVSDYGACDTTPLPGRVLTLSDGIVRIDVPGAGSVPFAVQGRSAVATVHGTEFIVETSQSRTAVFVLSGRVRVDPVGSDTGTDVGQGDGADVEAGAEKVVARPWPAARIDKVMALTRRPRTR